MNLFVDSPVTIERSSPPPERSNSSLGTVAKFAIGLGLIGTGAGATAAWPFLFEGGTELIERVQTIDNTRDVVPGFGIAD